MLFAMCKVGYFLKLCMVLYLLWYADNGRRRSMVLDCTCCVAVCVGVVFSSVDDGKEGGNISKGERYSSLYKIFRQFTSPSLGLNCSNH